MENETTFVLTRKSQLTGQESGMEFPIALREAIETWLSAPYAMKPFVQQAFPELDAEHREFLLTGITPEEWKETFGEEE